MQALILAGGKGTRLSPLTLDLPKPVIPLANKTLLELQIQLLKAAGIKDVILSLNYQPSIVEKIIGDGSDFGICLHYLIEPTPRGTAGAYKFAEKYIDSTTIILNGDILTDINLQKVIFQHKELKSSATIVLTGVEDPSAYGLVKVSRDNLVLDFVEKPKIETYQSLEIKMINAGIYILEPPVLNYIPEMESWSFENDLFPILLREAENFHAYVMRNNYWLDIGIPERYLKAHNDLINGKVKTFQINRDSNFQASKETEVDSVSIIDKDCILSPRAKIINSVLGKNVSVGEETVIQNSVIWSDTTIESKSLVSDSIIGSNCYIGKRVSPIKQLVVGSNTKLI